MNLSPTRTDCSQYRHNKDKTEKVRKNLSSNYPEKLNVFQGKAKKVCWENVSSATMQADVVFDILQVFTYSDSYGNEDLFSAALIFLFVLPILLAGLGAGIVIWEFYKDKCFPVATCCWDTSSFTRALCSCLLAPLSFVLVTSSVFLTMSLCWAPLTLLTCVPAVVMVYLTPLAKFLFSWAWIFSG